MIKIIKECRRLTETCCYQKLYGDLIHIVPHYSKKPFFSIVKSPSRIIITCVGGGGGGGAK